MRTSAPHTGYTNGGGSTGILYLDKNTNTTSKSPALKVKIGLCKYSLENVGSEKMSIVTVVLLYSLLYLLVIIKLLVL